MHILPPVPHTAPAFCNGNNLLSNPIRQLAVPPLIRRINDPPDRSPAAVAGTKRRRHRKRPATTGHALEVLDSDHGGDRGDDEVEVLDGVERELGCRGSAGEEAAVRVDSWGWRGAKVVEDDGHVLRRLVSYVDLIHPDMGWVGLL